MCVAHDGRFCNARERVSGAPTAGIGLRMSRELCPHGTLTDRACPDCEREALASACGLAGLPTPPDLATSPELGALYLLQQAIEVSTRVLIAANPVLVSDERPHWVEKSAAAGAAERLIVQLGGIAKAVEDYTTAVAEEAAEAARSAELTTF